MLVYVEVIIIKILFDVFEEFNVVVKKYDEIIECYLVLGNFDFLLKMWVNDMLEYWNVLGDILLKLFNVSESWIYVVMEEVKGE